MKDQQKTKRSMSLYNGIEVLNFPIQVVGKRLIAKEIKEEKNEKILIVSNDQPKELQLLVMTVGEDSQIHPGERILVKANWIYRFEYKKETYLLVPYDDIIGVINESA